MYFFAIKKLLKKALGLKFFLKPQNCPKLGIPGVNSSEERSLYILSEIRGSLPNFGHGGFKKKIRLMT